MLCLFYHYIWVGGYLVIGGGAHASIFLIGDHLYQETMNRFFEEVLNHRDIVIGHLIWDETGCYTANHKHLAC